MEDKLCVGIYGIEGGIVGENMKFMKAVGLKWRMILFELMRY